MKKGWWITMAVGIGCTPIGSQFDGDLRETLVFEPGQKEFVVLVHPRLAPQEAVINLVLERAHVHCLNQFQDSKVEIFSTRRGTFTAPDAWSVTGRCA